MPAAPASAAPPSWSPLASASAWLRGLSATPSPPDADSPAARVRAFVSSLHSRYRLPPSARLPAFAECGFGEAAARAAAAGRPLLVYLHSALAEDAGAFVSGALSHGPLVDWLDARFLCWAGSVAAADGYAAAAAFDAAAFPFLGVYVAAAGSTAARPRYQRVYAYEGGAAIAGSELLAALQAGCASALAATEALAAERVARVYERDLRAQQDRCVGSGGVCSCCARARLL